MVHSTNPNLDHKAEEVLEKWDGVKEEVEAKIILGRLELDHMKLIDNVEESLVAITNRSSRFDGEVSAACEEAEALRSRVRRRLLKKGTATEIPYKSILGAV